jgi:acetyl-CoA carboxylase biotin carboxyl carrier protein
VATELSEEDVLQILKLIEQSKFDYFQLELGDLKITVSKGDPLPLNASAQAVTSARPQNPAPSFVEPQRTVPPPVAAQAPQPEARAVPEGLLAITAPLLGTFYVSPEPGAPPFVSVGAKVTEDTTVGLIEVMKVFNSVRANVKGTIVEVVAQNGQFVEYGQPLFFVKP